MPIYFTTRLVAVLRPRANTVLRRFVSSADGACLDHTFGRGCGRELLEGHSVKRAATYDIDAQDQVKQFEGKKVRVHGTLDPSTKMIHVQ